LTATIKAPADAASQVFDPKDFRRACGQFATGITVVTVRDGDGVRGMTANSFTSVSLDPPLVLVSVDLRNRTHQLIGESGRFAVNVLSQQHRDWSDRFAGRHGDLQGQFDDVPHRLTDCGLPLFEGALASFVCRVYQAYPAGDHTLFVGQVERMECAPGAEPLLFYGGGYRGLDDQATA
jgi:flavin reductase (DIM6/NTAB) family NADH-FMN oxidoreductase RutF